MPLPRRPLLLCLLALTACAAPTDPSFRLASILKPTAEPTRTGPLLPSINTVDDYGLNGPVATVQESDLTLDAGSASNGHVTWEGTRTYDDQGRLLTSTSSVPDSARMASDTYTYDGPRLIRKESATRFTRDVTTYAYDAAGSLSTATTRRDEGFLVTRYQAFPNGFIEQELDDRGQVIQTRFALQDASGRLVEVERVGRSSSRQVDRYDGRFPVSSLTTTSTGAKINFWYEQGRLSRSEYVFAGAGAGVLNSPPRVTVYSDFDAHGNPLKSVTSLETLKNGVTTLTPQVVSTFSYTYR